MQMKLFTNLLMLVMLWPSSFSAMPADSIPSHSLSAKDIVLPAALITVGSMGFFDTVRDWDVQVHHEVQSWTHGRRVKFENYVQYVPLAATLAFGLNDMRDDLRMKDRLLLVGTSYALSATMVTALKYSLGSIRPYIYDEVCASNPNGYCRSRNPKMFNSFPSGHTATAFLGAELVRLTCGDKYPVAAWSAYVVAASVGFARVYNDRHWTTDILAGAGVGILSARIGWWLLPWEQRVLGSWLRTKDAESPMETLTVSPSFDGTRPMIALHITF